MRFCGQATEKKDFINKKIGKAEAGTELVSTGVARSVVIVTRGGKSILE